MLPSLKKKKLVEQKFKNQIIVQADISYIEVRIRENSWEKIRFSSSLSVDRISSPPHEMEGLLLDVLYTIRIAFSEGRIGSFIAKFSFCFQNHDTIQL